MDYNYDILLEYLSRTHCGKWQDFKDIVQNLNYADSLNINANEIRRMLSSLGHVEFLFNDSEQIYSVAPAGIVLLDNTFKGVLCGYRTEELLETLKNECRKYVLTYEEKIQNTAPKAVYINFKNRKNIDYFLEQTSLDLYITKNFTTRLLKSLPSIANVLNDTISCENVKLDINAPNVYLYDGFHNKPILAKGRGVTDFYLYERRFYNKRDYFLSYNNNFYKIDKHYGLCIVCSKLNKKFLQYHNNKLYISSVGVPELIDRALTLSSGLNRTTSQFNQYTYDKIHSNIAKLVSQKTGLQMEINNG